MLAGWRDVEETGDRRGGGTKGCWLGRDGGSEDRGGRGESVRR